MDQWISKSKLSSSNNNKCRTSSTVIKLRLNKRRMKVQFNNKMILLRVTNNTTRRLLDKLLKITRMHNRCKLGCNNNNKILITSNRFKNKEARRNLKLRTNYSSNQTSTTRWAKFNNRTSKTSRITARCNNSRCNRHKTKEVTLVMQVLANLKQVQR